MTPKLPEGPWRVKILDGWEVRVEAGPEADPRPICLTGILIGDDRADAITQAIAETIAQVPELLRDRQRLADLLADNPADGLLEEAILLARSVENDYRAGKGTGTEPVVSAWTWDKVRAFLRAHGQPCEG